MLSTILITYLICYTLVLIHEFIHYIFAWTFWKEVNEIKIGSDLLSIKICKLTISPIIGNSYITVNEKHLRTSHRFQIVLFFMTPLMFNIGANIIFVFMLHNSYIIYSMIFNTTLIIMNCLPIIGSDVGMTIKYAFKKNSD